MIIPITEQQYETLDNTVIPLTHPGALNAGDYVLFCDDEFWQSLYGTKERTWFRRYYLFRILSVSTRSIFINYDGNKIRYPRALPLQCATQDVPREIRDASFTHIITETALERVLGRRPSARSYILDAERSIPCACCHNLFHKTIDFIVMPYCTSCFNKAADEWNASLAEMAKKINIQVEVEE